MTNTVVRARIDEQTKEEASVVLAAMGLTVSDAFRLLMVRIARDKALPFDPLAPNDETLRRLALSLAISGDRRGMESTLSPLLQRQEDRKSVV